MDMSEIMEKKEIHVNLTKSPQISSMLNKTQDHGVL